MGRGRTRLPEGLARDRNITARIEAWLADQVDALAARMDVSRAWVVRRALIEYVEREAGQGGAS